MFTPENFCYWLQGCLEVNELKSLNEKQLKIIKDHLALVLTKKTPNRSDTGGISTLEFDTKGKGICSVSVPGSGGVQYFC